MRLEGLRETLDFTLNPLHPFVDHVFRCPHQLCISLLESLDVLQQFPSVDGESAVVVRQPNS
jgi:hypothetical protein